MLLSYDEIDDSLIGFTVKHTAKFPGNTVSNVIKIKEKVKETPSYHYPNKLVYGENGQVIIVYRSDTIEVDDLYLIVKEGKK